MFGQGDPQDPAPAPASAPRPRVGFRPAARPAAGIGLRPGGPAPAPQSAAPPAAPTHEDTLHAGGHLEPWARQYVGQAGGDPANYTMDGGQIISAHTASEGRHLSPWALNYVRDAKGDPASYSMQGGNLFHFNQDQGRHEYVETGAAPTSAAQPTRPAIGGDTSTTIGLRDSLVGDMQRRTFEAQQSGDREALIDVAAERAALDKFGFGGLQRHLHSAAMARAQRDQLGARTDALRAKTEPDDKFADPDRMYQETLARTGRADLAEAAASRAEITQRNRIGVSQGRQPAVDPNQAQSLLDTKYQTVAHLFGSKDGAPSFDLPDLFEHVQAIAPQGWDDPNSELAQAMAARVKALYGTDLPNQLAVPDNPREWATFGRLGGNTPIMPINRLLSGFANMTMQPEQNYQRRASAANWYSLLNGQPQRYK